MDNEQLKAQAEQLGLGSIIDVLLQKFGPILGQILLGLLARKAQAQQQGVLPATTTDPYAEGAFDIGSLLLVLLQQFGPSLLNQLVADLNARGDALSKFLAAVLQIGGTELLKILEDLLQSAQGSAAIGEILKSQPV